MVASSSSPRTRRSWQTCSRWRSRRARRSRWASKCLPFKGASSSVKPAAPTPTSKSPPKLRKSPISRTQPQPREESSPAPFSVTKSNWMRRVMGCWSPEAAKTREATPKWEAGVTREEWARGVRWATTASGKLPTMAAQLSAKRTNWLVTTV